MELKFWGCGSAFNPAMGNTSAFFEKGGNLYLLDCGESVYENLMRSMDLGRYNRIYVLVTHLHADHVGSLGSLLSYNSCVLGRKTWIVHPSRTIVDLLRLLGIQDDFYVYCEEMPAETEGIRAEAIPVNHVENMACFGYLLEDGRERIYYSGDAAMVPERVLELLKQGKLDRLYQDTSIHRHQPPSHCYYEELERAVARELRGRVYCMHLDEDCGDMLREKGFRIPAVYEQRDSG